MGEKDPKLITVGRTVLDVTNPKQVQIAWQDEESDIRIINNTAVKFNKDGSYEVIREDPSEEVKLVNGQLVQLVREDGVIVFEGATDDANETTLTVVDPTADRTISLPNETGTVLLRSTTDNTFIWY